MLQSLRDKCLDRAERCSEAASSAPDERVRQLLIDLEQEWNDVARSYEFIETLEQSLVASHHLPPEVDMLPKDFPPE